MTAVAQDSSLLIQLNCGACDHIRAVRPVPFVSLSDILNLCHRACPACGVNNYQVRIVSVEEVVDRSNQLSAPFDARPPLAQRAAR